MGTYCNGDFTIEAQTDEDMNLIIDKLNSLNTSEEGHFNIYDVDRDAIVYGKWSSSRIPNGIWQMNEVSNMLKDLVQEGKIQPVEFQASLQSEIESWYMSTEDWEIEKTEES